MTPCQTTRAIKHDYKVMEWSIASKWSIWFSKDKIGHTTKIILRNISKWTYTFGDNARHYTKTCRRKASGLGS